MDFSAGKTITNGTGSPVPYTIKWRLYIDRYISCVSPTGYADETVASGTGKPVPYKVRCKIQQRTCVARGTHGFLRTLEPGYQR